MADDMIPRAVAESMVAAALREAADRLDQRAAKFQARSPGENHNLNAAHIVRSMIPDSGAALDRAIAAARKVKPLVWHDADEGMCTKWRSPALGGSYELVSFKGEDGFAVNFHWGRPLCFWFIQGDPDEFGPTGPKMFPTLEAAKAAADADHAARILASLEDRT